MDGGNGIDIGDGGPGNDNCINFESEINCEDGPILLLAAASIAPNTSAAPRLTQDQLDPIANEALIRWLATVGLSESQKELLESATILIADLPGQLLAETMRTTIVIDASAANWGWFVGMARQGTTANFNRSSAGINSWRRLAVSLPIVWTC